MKTAIRMQDFELEMPEVERHFIFRAIMSVWHVAIFIVKKIPHPACHADMFFAVLLTTFLFPSEC